MNDPALNAEVRAVREQLRIANRIKVAEHLAARSGLGWTPASEKVWADVIHDLGIVVNVDV